MYGERIPPLAEDVARAHSLVAQESDPERKDALQRVENRSVHLLSGTLDSLIADCGPQGMAWSALEGGRSIKPGSRQILQDWFAPLRAFRGAQTPDGAMNGDALATKEIAWARDVLAVAANGGDIVDLEQSISKREHEQSDKTE